MKKVYTKEELQEILSKHKKWLLFEDGGERARLSEADLSRARLSEADLSRARLSGPACPGPTCPGPTCPGPTCPGPTCPWPYPLFLVLTLARLPDGKRRKVA